MTPSLRTFGVMYDHTFYKQVQIKHQATHKVGCQPGDSAYGQFNLSIFLWALCGYIWINILTLSPRGVSEKWVIANFESVNG